MNSEVPILSKAYRWYVKTLIGCSILTGLSFCVHCAGKITPTTWLIFGNGRIGVGTDWAWIRRRFHPTSGVPSGEWTVRWAKPWEDVGFGEYWEFSLFALLLAFWLVRCLWKNFIIHQRSICLGDFVAVFLGIVITLFGHVVFDLTPSHFWPQQLNHITTIGFALVPAIFIEKIRSVRRQHLEMRESSTLCHSCQYDLIGNVNDVCPECGVRVSQRQWEMLQCKCDNDETLNS